VKQQKRGYVVSWRIKSSLAVLLVGFVLDSASISLLYAQQSAIRPTILQKGDIADTPNREVVTATLELPPNGVAARHTHPGTEIGYVLDGSATLMIEGQAAREVKAGDSWIIGPGVPHEGRAGPTGVKVLGTIVVEKGKPLMTPSP
jgi:quercetin dioxygenase-like cupin family protein